MRLSTSVTWGLAQAAWPACCFSAQDWTVPVRVTLFPNTHVDLVRLELSVASQRFKDVFLGIRH